MCIYLRGQGFTACILLSREGEFTVEVLAFNNVSAASLRKQLFVVHEPCQPPPVKNMGPGKVQVGPAAAIQHSFLCLSLWEPALGNEGDFVQLILLRLTPRSLCAGLWGSWS